MELKQYLQAQFEAYPTLLRDVFAFASSEKTQIAMASVANKALSLDGVYLDESIGKDGAKRYQVFRHGESQGPHQKAPELAAWSFLGKSGVWDELGISDFPLLKSEQYRNRSKQWSTRRTRGGLLTLSNGMWLKWYMSVKVGRKVWALQRATSSFTSLSLQDQVYVDAIGLAMALMQQQAKQKLSSVGVDLADDNLELQRKIAMTEKEVKQDRQAWLPTMRSRVPADFYEKMVNFF